MGTITEFVLVHLQLLKILSGFALLTETQQNCYIRITRIHDHFPSHDVLATLRQNLTAGGRRTNSINTL